MKLKQSALLDYLSAREPKTKPPAVPKLKEVPSVPVEKSSRSKKMSVKMKLVWAAMTLEERQERVRKIQESRVRNREASNKKMLTSLGHGQ